MFAADFVLAKQKRIRKSVYLQNKLIFSGNTRFSTEPSIRSRKASESRRGAAPPT